MQKVIALNPDAEDQVTIAAIYREAKRYAQALVSADQAVKKDQENARAHYERACSLAQLGRKWGALAALKKVIAMDDEYAYDLAAESDLQPLAALPEFKALLPKEEAPAEPGAKPEQSKAAKP